jgi:rhamnulokinase
VQPLPVQVAAVDLGASSGRVMVGRVGPGVLDLDTAARFPNTPLRLPSGLHWNLPGLYGEVLAGLRRAVRDADLVSIGIDTWAVDYGLLTGDRLLGLPFHYRDETRNQRGPAAVHALVDPAELYQRNGLQFLPFNTVYQLAADPVLARGDQVLLLPDLLTFWLTGRRVAERTNASTTGLTGVRTREWDADLATTLRIPLTLLPGIVDPGTRVGGLLPHVADTVGADVPVLSVCSHDTASAVVGVPMVTDDAAFISLGTWGLVGLELEEPVVTEEAQAANFTNEGGIDGTVRFLTNVMGTWLLSETMRTWEHSGGPGPTELGPLLDRAAEVTAPVPVFDVQDARFVPPGDMPARIRAWFTERGQAAPQGYAVTVRSIVESLAVAYTTALNQASDLTGRRIGVVHVVGGGAQNALLCQAIADRSGRPVQAGPVEATALGNVLVQGRAAGSVGPGLTMLRELVARTQVVRRFDPRGEPRAVSPRDPGSPAG